MKYLGFVLEQSDKLFDYAGPISFDGKDYWIFLFPRRDKRRKKILGYNIHYTDSREEFERAIHQ